MNKVLEKLLNWTGEKAVDGAQWTAEKIGEGIIYALKGIGKGIFGVLSGNETIFIVIAMAGVFIIMSGNKKLGTKLTSGSFMGYVLLKVVLKC